MEICLKIFDLDRYLDWGLIKKFLNHVLATSKLSHRDTLMTASIPIITMEKPCCHDNCEDTSMTTSVIIVTMERLNAWKIPANDKTYLCTY